MSNPTTDTSVRLSEFAALKENNRKAELDIRTRIDELSALKDKHREAGRALDAKSDALSKELRENHAEYRSLQS